MIIHRKGVSKEDRMNLPDVIDGVERVTCMKILGVYFDNALSFKNQLERVLRGAASSMYAIKILRSKGLSGPPLWDVTTQTAVSKMLYASSAWWGYMDDTSRKRLNAIITRLVRLSCLSPKHKTFDSLCDTADQQLFDNILKNKHHVLHHLLPKAKDHHYDLRPRRHDRNLPRLTNYHQTNSFLNRMLYKDSY